jgi:hypothetical protein
VVYGAVCDSATAYGAGGHGRGNNDSGHRGGSRNGN